MVAVALPAPSRGLGPRRAISPHVRRRRCQVAAVVVVSLLALLAWALWGAVGWLGSGPLAAPESVPARPMAVVSLSHVVQPGDTLWSIARSFQATGEIRPLVDRLAAQTHGRPLQVGDRITLP